MSKGTKQPAMADTYRPASIGRLCSANPVPPELAHQKIPARMMLACAAIGLVSYMVTLSPAALYATAGCIALAVLYDPYLGLYLLGFSLPLTGMAQLIPGAFTASKGLALLLALSVLLRGTQIDFLRVFNSVTMRLYALVMLWSTLIFPFSGNYLAAFVYYITQLQLFGLAILIAVLLTDMQKVRQFAWWCLIGAAILGVLAVLQGLGGGLARHGERLSAGMNENELSEVLGVILFLSFFCLKQVKIHKTKLMVVCGCILLIVLSIMFTYSRNGIIGIIAAGTIGPLITRNLSVGKRFSIILAVTGILAVGFFLMMGDYFGNTSKLTAERIEEHRYGGTGGRMTWIWPAKLDRFFCNPVIGGGLGTDITMRPGSSHNDMIHFLSNQGLPGFLFFMLLNLNRFRESNQAGDKLIRSALVSMTIFNFLVGLTHNTYHHRQYAVGIGVVAAVTVLGQHKHRRKIINRRRFNEDCTGNRWPGCRWS